MTWQHGEYVRQTVKSIEDSCLEHQEFPLVLVLMDRDGNIMTRHPGPVPPDIEDFIHSLTDAIAEALENTMLPS